ncbi:MAG: anthranilate synthase component I [Actinobacteria bacterium]|nr:anthranilate synthase component I [Actinomycetota bacterium]
MYQPSKREYIEKAQNYNLIPVYREYVVDTETPASIFMKAGGLEKESFLLESIEGAINLSRYSFMGVGIKSRLVFDNNVFSQIRENQGERVVRIANPLKELEKVMGDYHICKDPNLNHFVGGAVGYLSYDLVKYFENIKLPEEKIHFPEMMLYLTDMVIVFDHLFNRMKIVSTIKIDKDTPPERAYSLSVEKIEDIQARIFQTNVFKEIRNNSFGLEGLKSNIDNNFISGDFIDFNSLDQSSNGSFGDISKNSNFTKPDFLEAVEKAKKYIIEGEAFQVVLSQRFSKSYSSNPFSIYRRLRTINPSPYMFYINFGDFQIIGSSPEPLVKISGRKILTCPIAGTRKRGKDPREDKILINDLLSDEKERAEHNMLVDLARNDLGRVCKYGSVKVKKCMSVEKYSHVIHLVSRVEGILDPNKSIYQALESTFPAGTLTGAPKVRAMQIISELEPCRRGPYGGVVGYFGYDGSLDSCITIRTALVKDGKVFIQAGAGIVYDSVPENEWKETINKAAPLFRAVS